MAASYVDSSAIVKLAVREPESVALRRYLRVRRSLISSALARTEVLRALLPGGDAALAAGRRVLDRVDLARVNDRVLNLAATLSPLECRLVIEEPGFGGHHESLGVTVCLAVDLEPCWPPLTQDP